MGGPSTSSRSRPTFSPTMRSGPRSWSASGSTSDQDGRPKGNASSQLPLRLVPASTTSGGRNRRGPNRHPGRDTGEDKVMDGQIEDRLWSVQDVSDYLGVPVHTIYAWRSAGTGPPGRRVGKRLRYRPQD